MSASVLKNNRQLCVASPPVSFQCGDKTQNSNNKNSMILCSLNNEASQSTQTNNNINENLIKKNDNKKYCNKCFIKNITKESVCLLKESSLTVKHKPGKKRRIYSNSESEKYQNQQNTFLKTNKRFIYNNQSKKTMRLRRKGVDVSEINEKNGRYYYKKKFKLF